MSDAAGNDVPVPRWQSPHGDVIACTEKLKVLRHNLGEIRQVSQDALDDAVLMGCDPGQFRAVLVEIVSTLESAYATLQARAPKEPS
ncbi:MAG: hypothetical protein IPL06_21730 [Betaproteobacteria bacterium]|nr:hypothetical protein [Betaproteobacteria bacterium]